MRNNVNTIINISIIKANLIIRISNIAMPIIINDENLITEKNVRLNCNDNTLKAGRLSKEIAQENYFRFTKGCQFWQPFIILL